MKIAKFSDWINELNKHETYKDHTSTPYNGGEKPNSRFMPRSEEFKEGWKLVGMEPVNSKTGKKTGEEIPIEKFTKLYNVSFKSIHIAITAALGEIANLGWIERLSVPREKRYLMIYLGKFGLEFKGDIYAPIFEIPLLDTKEESQIKSFKGDSFWLAAGPVKRKEGKGEDILAKTVLTYPDNISDDELMKKTLHNTNTSNYKRWIQQKTKELEAGIAQSERKPVMDENTFKSQFAVIRNDNEKNFFVIFKYGVSESDIVKSAQKAVTGMYSRNKEHVIFRGKPQEGNKRERAEVKPYFNLEKDTVFQYYCKDENSKFMEPNAYNILVILNAKNPSISTNDRKVEVRILPKSSQPNLKKQTFELTLKPGDNVKIPDARGKSIKYKSAEIMPTEFKSQNLKRVAIKWTQKEE